MKIQVKRKLLSIGVFVFVFSMLTMVHLKVETKMLLLERLFTHGGWIEIVLLSAYGAIVAWFMQDVKQAPKWRLVTWTVFSVWFFLQLFMGIVVSDIFLLTGKLHLPIPAMIIGGPIYRGQLSVMSILFLSTIMLSGPSWCSHLCYFGALDGLFSKQSRLKKNPTNKNNMAVKLIIVAIVVLAALLMRLFGVSSLISTIIGLLFGCIGLGIILFISRKKGKMVHCTVYCPVGTLVNFLSRISPFRLRIDTSCTNCMVCIPTCRYDALNITAIKNKKPEMTCTLCGDCLNSCHANSFQYKFLGLKPETARNLYLFITIALHAIFMGLGRI